jgi:hypothetical protein
MNVIQYGSGILLFSFVLSGIRIVIIHKKDANSYWGESEVKILLYNFNTILILLC